MPTFRSIGVHPELRSRLVTESISVTGREGGQQSAEKHFQPIHTPQALLCKNPSALKILNRPIEKVASSNDCTTVENDPLVAKQISHSQALKLRHDIASAMIDESQNGKRIQQIRNVLNHATKRRRSETRTSEETAVIVESQDREPFCPYGTISAFDILKFDKLSACSMSTQGGDNQHVLSTGLQELDDLISLPLEHAHVSFQMDMPDSEIPRGVPYGHVIQFSGPPATGKTQIALRLACSPGLYQTWYLSSNSALHLYARRLAEISFRYQQRSVQHDPNLTTSILGRTIFSSVSDEYDVLNELSRLEQFLCSENISNDNESLSKRILLVLDSCSGCLSSADTSLLITVAGTIKRLTRMYGLATVLVNGTVANRVSTMHRYDSEQQPEMDQEHSKVHYVKDSTQQQRRRTLKPSLGRLWWNTAADIHVWLDSMQNGDLRATLDRHPSKVVDAEEGFSSQATVRISIDGM